MKVYGGKHKKSETLFHFGLTLIGTVMVLVIACISLTIGVIHYKNLCDDLSAENEELRTTVQEQYIELFNLNDEISSLKMNMEIQSHVDSYSKTEDYLDSLKFSQVKDTEVINYIHASVTAAQEHSDSLSDYPSVFGYLFNSDFERDKVERVVMSESGNQPYDGKKAVAQCILDSCLVTGDRAYIIAVCQEGQYAPPYSGEVSDEVKRAVSDVFDKGDIVVDEPIRYFYSPVGGFYSSWHETSPNLDYVDTIGDHKFYKVKGT